MARWHVWVVIIAGLGILSWGLLTEAGVGPEKVTETVTKSTRDFFTGSGDEIGRNISVSGTFSPPDIDFTDSPVSRLTLRYTTEEPRVTVSGVRISSSEDVTLTLEKYKGELRLDGREIFLDGKAGTVRVNGVVMNTGSGAVEVKSSGVVVDSMEALGIDVRRFRTESMSGRLMIRQDVDITLDEESLDIDAFLGKITLGKKFTIRGDARKVFVGGENYRTVVS